MDLKCECKFVEPGLPMNTQRCPVHLKSQYACGLCHCMNYRPQKAPVEPRFDGLPGKHWALCVCGHIAQDHN